MANFLQRILGMGQMGMGMGYPGQIPGIGGPWTPPINPNASAPMPGGAPTPPSPRFQGPPWLQKMAAGANKMASGLAGGQPGQVPPQVMQAMLGQLLASSGPAPKGTRGLLQPFGEAMLAGSQARSQFDENEMRRKLIEAQIGHLRAAPAANAPTYGSPIGKLLADRDLAERGGNTAGVEAIDAAIKKEIGSGSGGPDLNEILRVRNDITRNSGEFLAAQTGYDKVVAASESDTPAGDMSLIFGFMKVLDPGSIVKEGEFATVQNSAGIPEQIRGVYNRVIRGERLTPEQRQDFTYQARQQFEPMVERQKRLVNDAKSFAERNKLPFADIVPEYLLPLLPDNVQRPPERNPGAQLPSLWGQIKEDFSNFLGEGNQPVRVTSDAEYEALPSGSQYIAPDGSTRTKR